MMRVLLPRSCNVQPLKGVVAFCTMRIVQRASHRAAIVQPTLHDRNQPAGPARNLFGTPGLQVNARPLSFRARKPAPKR